MPKRKWILQNFLSSKFSTNRIVHGCAVLLYHRIFSPTIDAQLLSVTPKNFEQHLKFLTENYEIISYQTLVHRLMDKNLHERSICLTFDDGYLDNFTEAFPLLKKYNIPATIFVCTANIGNSQEFWWDMLENIFLAQGEKYLDWNALSQDLDPTLIRYLNLQENFKSLNIDDRTILLSQLSKSYPARKKYRSMNKRELSDLSSSELISLGSHTENHYSLGRIDQESSAKEIRASTQTIREITSCRHLPFSYPFGGQGDCRNDLDKVFESEKIDAVFVNQHGICNNNTNLKKIPRILIRNLLSLEFGAFINNLWN
jgi:peptidoglycan/xylan/chitin deacetylase (PgdA/CDA1 family)